MSQTQDIITGLNLFLKLAPDFELCIEHNMIFGPHNNEIKLTSLTKTILKEIGWRTSDGGYWYRQI